GRDGRRPRLTDWQRARDGRRCVRVAQHLFHHVTASIRRCRAGCRAFTFLMARTPHTRSTAPAAARLSLESSSDPDNATTPSATVTWMRGAWSPSVQRSSSATSAPSCASVFIRSPFSSALDIVRRQSWGTGYHALSGVDRRPVRYFRIRDGACRRARDVAESRTLCADVARHTREAGELL